MDKPRGRVRFPALSVCDFMHYLTYFLQRQHPSRGPPGLSLLLFGAGGCGVPAAVPVDSKLLHEARPGRGGIFGSISSEAPRNHVKMPA